jgi:hypothetical protein
MYQLRLFSTFYAENSTEEGLTKTKFRICPTDTLREQNRIDGTCNIDEIIDTIQ